MDETQVSDLISQNLTQIYGYAFGRLYNKDDVDELTSEIVYEIILSAKRLKSNTSFWAFAWKIAENTFRKFIKRKEFTKMLEPLPANDDLNYLSVSPEEEYVETEAKNESLYLLRCELSLLSKTHREVCVSYYIYNKSCSEIADEQNISINMVKYHLFKTRKLLKEGIGMTRKLGEKSYNPGTFRINFWGDRNYYGNLFNRKLPGSIMLAAYDMPMSAEELSIELGVSMPYLEEEIETLETAGALKKTAGKYRTNLVILTEVYEKYFAAKVVNSYPPVAKKVFNEVQILLPQIRAVNFSGNSYDDNRLMWTALNIAMLCGYEIAKAKSPIGKAPKLPLGSYGFLFGHDNDYTVHHFGGICMEVWNKPETAWFSAENYSVIDSCQHFVHNKFDMKIEAMCSAILEEKPNELNDTILELIDGGFVLCVDGVMKANFAVFNQQSYQDVCRILKPIADLVADLMIRISDMAEHTLVDFVPESVKTQCGDIVKIHHRLDVAAILMEELVADKKLIVPSVKTPICVFGVKAN